MPKHKYDPVRLAVIKETKAKVKSDSSKKTTVKDVADRLTDIEILLRLRA